LFESDRGGLDAVKQYPDLHRFKDIRTLFSCYNGNIQQIDSREQKERNGYNE